VTEVKGQEIKDEIANAPKEIGAATATNTANEHKMNDELNPTRDDTDGKERRKD